MYRILVTGSHELKRKRGKHLVAFTRALGKRIMAESNLVLLTGGLERLGEGQPAVDYVVVRGALDALRAAGGDAQERILTLVPAREFVKAKRLRDVKLDAVEYSNVRSRRYAMVCRSDAVIAIEGTKATKENIDLAWTLGKPLLPVPCTGGNAEEAWKLYGDTLKQTLRLHPDEIDVLEGPLDHPGKVADCCVAILRRIVRPRCFVAMKFDYDPTRWAYGIIEEVATNKCSEPVRVDRLPGVANIVDTIWGGIRTSDSFIADISGDSPNVFYELGIAHALRKDVIILVHSPSGELPKKIAFDIQSYRVIPYRDEESLRTVLMRELPDRCRRNPGGPPGR
jgi:predicted Rossmann-fold nucleotide-binding protein